MSLSIVSVHFTSYVHLFSFSTRFTTRTLSRKSYVFWRIPFGHVIFLINCETLDRRSLVSGYLLGVKLVNPSMKEKNSSYLYCQRYNRSLGLTDPSLSTTPINKLGSKSLKRKSSHFIPL